MKECSILTGFFNMRVAKTCFSIIVCLTVVLLAGCSPLDVSSSTSPSIDTSVTENTVDVDDSSSIDTSVTDNTIDEDDSPGIDTSVTDNTVYEDEISTSNNLFKQVFSDIRRTDVDKAITFSVLGNNIDSANNMTVTQQPANGILAVGGSQLTFTPQSGVSGKSVAKVKVDWLDGTSDTATIILYTEQVGSKVYFDSVNGNDAHPGTRAQPKRTGISAAINNANDGDRIYIKGNQTYDIRLDLNGVAGTVAAPIVVKSYGGRAVLNYTGTDGTTIWMMHKIGRLVFEDIEVQNPNTGAIGGWNNSNTNPQDVVFDNIKVSSASIGINWQAFFSSKCTVVRSDVSDNNSMGLLGSAEMLIFNNTFRRNGNSQDYAGGPMKWGVYIENTPSAWMEGNIVEDSEGLLKLRATKNYTIQKNTFRRSWIMGVSIGGDNKSGATGRSENGLFAHNLIDDAQHPIHLADADGQAGGGIHNLDIRNNVAINGNPRGGYDQVAVLYAGNHDDVWSDVRVFDNILWGDQTTGYMAAHIRRSDIELYNNILGGGTLANPSWDINNVIKMHGATANIHDNILYRFYDSTVFGISLDNGNTEITAIPEKALNILDQL